MQGEGVLIGCRQIFVRFAECNLACAYCDTPFHAGPTCRIETGPGTGKFSEHANPVKLAEVTGLIRQWQGSSNNVHHSLALTGGEPLLHADTLRRWLPPVQTILAVFLETNGTLPRELEKVLHLIDLISMDIKGSATGAPIPWKEHVDFLTIAGERLCQVKLVVDAGTPESELLEAAQLVNHYAPHVPLILQPRSTATGPALNGTDLLKIQSFAAAGHSDVRIIPQIHAWLGVA